MSLIENLHCEYNGSHEENPNIHELKLIWKSFRDDDTNWTTIAYNIDTEDVGIAQTNYDADPEDIKNSMFEYIDNEGSSCYALSCEYYTNGLDYKWDFYGADIMQLYKEYCADKEKFDKLIKKIIIDGQL